MDDLLHFLRGEIAMDGDDGTPVSRLDTFIETHYTRLQERDDESWDDEDEDEDGDDTDRRKQNVDEAFKDFVWRQLCNLPEIKVAHLKKPGETIAAPSGRDASESAQSGPKAGDASIVPDQSADPSLDPALAGHSSSSSTSLALQPQQDRSGELDSAANSSFLLPPLPPRPLDDPSTNAAPADANSSMAMVIFKDAPEATPKNKKGAVSTTVRAKRELKAERSATGKGMKARDARLAGDEYEFCELSPEERAHSSRADLLARYGPERLRVAADPESCYASLTGSHERRSKLTHHSYQILQAIARGREDGKTVIQLGKEFDHDQKSLFHFVKNLLDMGLIVKLKISDKKSTTSRCIHRHYLETSKHWALWQTKDLGSTEPRTAGADEEEDEDDVAPPAIMSILTVAHVNGNEPLVRARILAALRREPDHILPHLDIVFKIGFTHRPHKMVRRRINRIIVSMVNQGLIEKIGVARDFHRGEQSCIRLLESSHTGEGQDATAGAESAIEERPNFLATLAVEKQIVDLLAEAGASGLTIRELRSGLGDLNVRILETILSKHERAEHPPHLCDFAIHSVLEIVGREKRLRWFTIAGYKERCRLDGLSDLADTVKFSHPAEAGGWSALESLGFYETPGAFDTYADSWDSSSKGIDRYAAYPEGVPGNGKKKPRAKSSYPTGQRRTADGRPLGRPRGSTKAAKLEAAYAEGDITLEEYEKQKALLPRYRKTTDDLEREKLEREAQKVAFVAAAVADGKSAEEAEAAWEEAENAKRAALGKRKRGASGSAVPVGAEEDGAQEEEQEEDFSESELGAPGTPAMSDSSTPGPKRPGRPKKPPRPKLAPDGTPFPPPVKGRPRKYPVGTTSRERAKILAESRIAMGLPPRAPKSRAKKSNEGEASTDGWLGNGKAGPANKPKEPKPRAKKQKEGETPDGNVAAGEGGGTDPQKKPRKPRAKKQKTDDAAADEAGATADASAGTPNGQGVAAPTKKPRAKKAKKGEADADGASAQRGAGAPAIIDLTAGPSIPASVYAHVRQAAGGQDQAKATNATPAEVVDVNKHSEARGTRQQTPQQQQTTQQQAESLLRHLHPATADSQRTVEQPRSGPSQPVPPLPASSEPAPADFPAAPAEVPQQTSRNIQAVLSPPRGEQEVHMARPATPAAGPEAQAQTGCDQELHLAVQASSSQTSPAQPVAGQSATAVKGPSGSPASIRQASLRTSDGIEQSTPAMRHRRRSSLSSQPSGRPDFVDKLPPSGRQRRAKRFREESVSASTTVSIDAEDESTSEARRARLGHRGASGAEELEPKHGTEQAEHYEAFANLAPATPAQPGNATMIMDVSDSSVLGDTTADVLRGTETPARSASKQGDKKRKAEPLAPSEPDGPPPPKRGRGRPRKYPRTGPDPMKPFKYGIYPNLVLYPPVVPRTPLEPDARKTRRQIREEGGSASPAPISTEQEPSMRDLLSRFNQPRHASPQAPASPHLPAPDMLSEAQSEPPPTTPAMVNSVASPSSTAAAEPEDAMLIDGTSAISQDVQASELAAYPSLPPLPPSVGYTLPEMPLPSAGTTAFAGADAGMLISQHNGSFPSDTHFLNLAGNGVQNGAGTIALIPANTVTEPSKKPERKNYSIMIHENEHALSLKEAGGIATEGSQFTKIWQAYMQKKHGLEQPPNALDRRTHASVMRGLQTRGQVKRTVIQLQGANGKMTQTAVYHLAEVSLDGPEMQAFAKALQDEKFNMNVKTNWLPGRKVIRKKAAKPEDKRVRNRAERSALLEASIHSEMDARAFFGQEWRIVAQKYGWQFGTIGKARTLHEFLAESINDDNDSSFIISSSPETRIFASPYVIHDLPLALYLKLHAVHGHLGSELQQLDDYLAGEGNPAQTPVSRLPQEITKMLLPEKASNVSKTNQLLRILVAFRVLIPIEQTETVTSIVAYSGVDREPRYFREREFDGSVYWMLANTSPIYDLHSSKGGSQVLVSEQSTLDLAGIEQYWDTTEAITFRALDPSELLPPNNDHPATLHLDSTIAPTAKMESRWQRSYMLFRLQKQYIERIVSEQGGAAAFLDDEEGLNQLAYKIWAPVDVVRTHVARLANEAERQLMEVQSKPSRRTKKKKTKKSKAVEAHVLESSDSEPGVIEKPRRKGKKSKKLKRRLAAEERGEADLGAMRAETRQQEERSEAAPKSVKQKKSTADQILARGAKSSKQGREQMWDAIIGRFVAEHGAAEEALDPDQLEFLRVWFVSPGGINAKDLQQHLETMLEDAALVQLPLLSSKKAVLNRPDLGKGKPEDAATVSKITQARRGAPAKPSEKRIARAARAPEAEPVPELPFTLPDVCFVVPEDAPRKTPAHGWSEAEDDQLRDFYVILQSRANHLNVRLSLEPARAFYPGLTSKILVDRLRRLASMHGDAPYLDVLQDTWQKLWLAARAKGEVPDPEPNNFGRFDIAKHRTFLCANVNKQSIRFQAMDPTRSASALYRDLPLDARDLYASCHIDAPNPLRKDDSPKVWDYLYSTITTALKEKDYKYRSLTRPLARLDQAVEAGISSNDRAAAFSTRYCYRDQKISLECLEGAGRCESSLKSQESTVWPIPVEDGEMLALSHLFSEDLVNFEVDTLSTLEKRPYRDYRTRKIDDEAFEHDMSVSLKESYKSLTAPLFDMITLPPAESPSANEAEVEAAATSAPAAA